MYFNMSKETISQFTTMRGIVKKRLGINLSLASDTLVEDFFVLVGTTGDQLLIDQALLVYRSLAEDNQRRSKAKILNELRDEMLSTYQQRNEAGQEAA